MSGQDARFDPQLEWTKVFADLADFLGTGPNRIEKDR